MFLSNKITVAFSWVMFVQIGKGLLQILSMVTLSRLILPNVFGSYAFSMVVYSLLVRYAEIGAPQYLIQTKSIDIKIINSIFISCMKISILSAIIFLVITFSLSSGEYGLYSMNIMLVLSILIVPFYTLNESLLKRELSFKWPLVFELISLLIGVLFSILVAYIWNGYIALGCLTFVPVVVRAILNSTKSLIKITEGFDDNPRYHISEVRKITVSSVLGYFVNSLPQFSLGTFGMVTELGFYNRGQSISNLVITQIINPTFQVLHPYLSKIQCNAKSFNLHWSLYLNLVLHVSTPLLLAMYVYAGSLISLALGDSWGGAIPFVKLILLYSLVEPIAGALAIAINAKGRYDLMVRWRIFSLALIAGAVGIGLSLGSGLAVVAWVVYSGLFIRLPLFVFIAFRAASLDLIFFLRIVGRILVLSCMALTGLYYSTTNSCSEWFSLVLLLMPFIGSLGLELRKIWFMYTQGIESR